MIFKLYLKIIIDIFDKNIKYSIIKNKYLEILINYFILISMKLRHVIKINIFWLISSLLFVYTYVHNQYSSLDPEYVQKFLIVLYIDLSK